MKRMILLCSALGLVLAAPAAFAGDCDVNGDGACGADDLSLVMDLQGAAAGDADFVEAADLDSDGVISLADASQLKDLLSE